MLLKIGNVVINTEQLIFAELKGEGEKAYVYIRLGGGGVNDATSTSREFRGTAALPVWEALTAEAREIPVAPEDDRPRDPRVPFDI